MGCGRWRRRGRQTPRFRRPKRRASDGALVWRYRAAPDDKRMIAYGRIESVWPVHGSVLVEDGTVYCAAGRTSYLDGGMYLLKLDLKTGKKLLEKNYFSRNTETGETVEIYKAQTGTNIYMRHAVMNRNFEIKDGYQTHIFSSMGFLDDTWWERSCWIYGKHFYSGCFLWAVRTASSSPEEMPLRPALLMTF